MRIAIMQPYVFPYIGYFQLINAVDAFVFYDDVNFIKKGYINRNSILVNGKSNQFVIPCKAVSQNKLIKDVVLAIDDSEKEKLIKTLHLAYKRAPFFNVVMPLIEEVINNEDHITISDLAVHSVKQVSSYLGIQKKWVLSSLDHEDSTGQEKGIRLINITKKEGAAVYVNPIGGKQIYDKEVFKSHQVELKFLKPKPIAYQQFKHEFVPWLSIIDVLMFNSIEEVKLLLNQYEWS